MLSNSIDKKIEIARNILLVGIGGGFDFALAIPIYQNLISLGKTVYWANLSFSRLDLLPNYSKFVHVTAETEDIPESRIPS